MMVKDFVVQLIFETKDYQIHVTAEMKSGEKHVVDVYFEDERGSHIRGYEAYGKTLEEVNQIVHDRDVAMIRSWVK